MKIYAVLLVVSAVVLGMLDATVRDHTLAGSSIEELDLRAYETQEAIHRAQRAGDDRQLIYSGQLLELIERERWRRRANFGIPILLALFSLVFFVTAGRRWRIERLGPIPLLRGTIELMSPEEVSSSPERYDQVRAVSFNNRGAAVRFLRKAASETREGEVLGQVWKQTHVVDIEGKKKSLGTVWIAQLA